MLRRQRRPEPFIRSTSVLGTDKAHYLSPHFGGLRPFRWLAYVAVPQSCRASLSISFPQSSFSHLRMQGNRGGPMGPHPQTPPHTLSQAAAAPLYSTCPPPLLRSATNRHTLNSI